MTARNYTNDHRARAKANGAVIVYAMLTSPEAIKAWRVLQETYGNNRDAIEAAIIDCHEQMEIT